MADAKPTETAELLATCKALLAVVQAQNQPPRPQPIVWPRSVIVAAWVVGLAGVLYAGASLVKMLSAAARDSRSNGGSRSAPFDY